MQVKQLSILPLLAALSMVVGCNDTSTPERPAMATPPDVGKPFKPPATKAEKIAAINASAAPADTKKAAIDKVNAGP